MQRFFLTFSLVACLGVPAQAATDCPEHFAGGMAPTVTNPKLQARTQEVNIQSAPTPAFLFALCSHFLECRQPC